MSLSRCPLASAHCLFLSQLPLSPASCFAAAYPMLPIVQRRFLCLDAGRLPPGNSNILKAQNRPDDASIMATQGDIVDILQHAYIALCVCDAAWCGQISMLCCPRAAQETAPGAMQRSLLPLQQPLVLMYCQSLGEITCPCRQRMHHCFSCQTTGFHRAEQVLNVCHTPTTRSASGTHVVVIKAFTNEL